MNSLLQFPMNQREILPPPRPDNPDTQFSNKFRTPALPRHNNNTINSTTYRGQQNNNNFSASPYTNPHNIPASPYNAYAANYSPMTYAAIPSPIITPMSYSN